MSDSKPLVLHYVSSPGTLGGLWTYAIVLSESDLKERYRFDQYSPSHTQHGIEPLSILRLAKMFKQKRPEILHMHGLNTPIIQPTMAARLARVPRVLLAVHVFIEDSHMRKPWKKALSAQFLEPVALRRANAVYNVCAFGAAKPQMTHFVKNDLGVIDNAVRISEPLTPDASLRASFGFKPDDIIALSVGRAELEKGWHLLAEAMEILDREGLEQPKLLLVGDGPHKQMIEERLKPLIAKGRVVMPGRRNDVMELHAISDFFVSPTLRDYQPLVFLDAMLQHKPILTTQVGGNPEMVVDDKTGVLVAPKDVKALVREMKRLSIDADLRKRLGDAGRVRVETKFSLGRLTQEVGAVYDQLMTSLPGWK